MQSEADRRAAIVAEARSWLGTPYHHCADIKGVGVDCGMLIVRVFVDAGGVPPFDPRPYASDWHMHRSEEKYLGFVTDRCVETIAPQPGDIMVFRFGRCYAHGGILTRADPLTIVHAYQPARCVVEDDVSRGLPRAKGAPRFFTLSACERVMSGVGGR